MSKNIMSPPQSILTPTNTMNDTTPKKIPLSSKLVVGGLSGVIGITATFPIDIVKTRLQTQVVNAQGVLPYSGPINCFKKVVKAEGAIGLYRGLPPTVIGVIPEKAIKLAANDFFREKLGEEPGKPLPIMKQILAGASAGFCQVVATNPMEIVKIRLQTQHGLAAADRLTAVGVVQHLGLKGLYRGTSSTLMRDVPYAAIFFPTYATVKSALGGENAGIFSVLLSGATAGAAAAAAVTPADVVKSRFQMRGANYASVLDCYNQVVSKEGYGALFKGVFPRMMVQAPLFAITLLAFEIQKKYMASA